MSGGGVPTVGKLPIGGIFYLPETVGGVTTKRQFMVLGHQHYGINYTFCLRLRLFPAPMIWRASTKVYNGSEADNFCNVVWRGYLPSAVRAAMLNSPVLVNAGQSNDNLATLYRYAFLPSAREINISDSAVSSEGSISHYFLLNPTAPYREATPDGSATKERWWLRSPVNFSGDYAAAININALAGYAVAADFLYMRPAFNLLSSLEVEVTP